MSLDHATGDLSGEVVKGSFSGQSLDALDEKALHRLWEECRADGASMQLLENYMDRRLGPAWRESFAGEGSAWKANNDGMDRNEAYEILGLTPGANRAEIKEAHKKLMLGNHPDHGGSPYLAMKINRARDVLLDD